MTREQLDADVVRPDEATRAVDEVLRDFAAAVRDLERAVRIVDAALRELDAMSADVGVTTPRDADADSSAPGSDPAASAPGPQGEPGAR